MKGVVIVFYCLAVLFLFSAVGSCATAAGALHQIVGLVCTLIAIVLVGLGALLEVAVAIRDRLTPHAAPGPARQSSPSTAINTEPATPRPWSTPTR